MPRSRFDSLSDFIRRRRRWIIISWLVVVILSVSLLPSFFSNVSYNITSGFGGPSNTESQRAQDIINAEFPSFANNTSSNSIIVLVQNVNPYTSSLKSETLALNQTLSRDRGVANYTGINSVYSIEYGLLNSSLNSALTQVGQFVENISSINSGLYALQQNLSVLSLSIFQLEEGINQTAQLVYGIPNTFTQIWEGIVAQGVSDPYVANQQANTTLYQMTGGLAGDQLSVSYYRAFYNVWNASFQSLPSDTLLQREQTSVQQSVGAILSNPSVDNGTRQTIDLVAAGLNATDYSSSIAVSKLTISTMASSLPSSLSTSLEVSSESLVSKLYSFGPLPSNSTLGNYAITLFSNSIPSSQSSGFSIRQILNSSYALGRSPSYSEKWNLAAELVANGTATAFSGSPLFYVNATSFADLLGALSQNSSQLQISTSINNEVANHSFLDYPFLPTSAITNNFVSSDNSSTILIFNFSTTPGATTISRVMTDVKQSGIESMGTIYITGGPVITQDVQNVFTPALDITLGPGIGISILIVGLLFLSPVAAIIPILMGAISIAVALPAIYLGIVVIGHGSITFLTPTLTTLLMLGLAVDYAVLQLRRTREERLKGKTIEESVGISVKWAGQAVLTAGITVVVAYIVMAIANVPLFSSVGTAIALGVSILLAASLTLLPSLELAIGDRIFWPKRNRAQQPHMRSRLSTLAEATLKRKVAIAAVISLVAFGAFYTSYHSPVGEDFLKLIPNFPSNQGLTALTNAFGGGLVSPTQIVVLLPTAVTYGANQFNQSMLTEIEIISDSASNSSGVVSVTSPTRPYGSLFSYQTLGNMSDAIRQQYESGMYSLIGSDNKTVLINVGLSNSSQSQQAIDSLLGMEQNIGKLSLLNGVTIHYAGSTQQTYDSQTFLIGLLPQVIIILAAAVYVILFLQLRSAFTPLRLIFTILCSVVFSLAMLSVVFKDVLGLPILDFAPLFVVVTMLGVGIDYDIFFVSRIREEVLSGKDDNEAITTAVDKVWVTILCLGLVLATVFASLLITNIAMLQEISLAVAGAIVLDVVIVILFFVPSLMGLAERFNWWPSKIGRSRRKSQG